VQVNYKHFSMEPVQAAISPSRLRKPATVKPSPEYLTLSGAEFDAAVSGRWTETGVVPRWLESPRLKYYMPQGITMTKDERTLILAVVTSVPTRRVPKPLKRAVGILELQVNPYDDREIWLKYITVDPQRQRVGIAKELLTRMVSYLAQHPRLLVRSRPSEEGRAKIQAYITRLLDTNSLPWSQGD
jgi:ribosomal protein S18 acetylase RimI-like enzyme